MGQRNFKRILIIDGEYFGHRSIFGLQREATEKGYELTLDLPEEQINFKNALHNGLNTLIATFNNDKRNLIDNVLFLTDCNSWRKQFEPFRPYYLKDDTTTPIKYKENRVEKREKSDINWENFFKIYEEFCNEISEKIPFIKINGLEADDLIALTASRLRNENVESVVFCTDGDLKQTVKDNFILFRNIKSVAAPYGEFVISSNLANKLANINPATRILQGGDDHDELFQIIIGQQEGIQKREVGKGIDLSNPWEIIFEKSICGDAKDNIFPILRWKASTGTKNFKVTVKHIEKALAKHGYKFDNITCAKILQDKDALVNMLLALIEVTKQSTVTVKDIGNHFKHNLRLNLLSEKNMPIDCVKQFDTIFDTLKESLINDEFDFDLIKKPNNNVNKNIKLLNDSVDDNLVADILKS